MLTAVVCSGRNRPQDSKGQWLPIPRFRSWSAGLKVQSWSGLRALSPPADRRSRRLVAQAHEQFDEVLEHFLVIVGAEFHVLLEPVSGRVGGSPCGGL